MKFAGLLWSSALLISTIADLNAEPPPYIPYQTEIATAVWHSALADAVNASAAAEEELLTLLDAEPTRRYLKEFDDGSGFYALEANQILDMVLRELSVAELVHNFGNPDDPTHEGNCGMDVTLHAPLGGPSGSEDDGDDIPYFYNQWLLQALGYIPVDLAQNDFSEQSETGFFHYPPMTYVDDNDDDEEEEENNATVPTISGAADRPTYAALNIYRGSAGNPQCGPVSAIFSRRYVQDRAVGSPVDTGAFFGTCGLGGPDDAPGYDPGMFSDCNSTESGKREEAFSPSPSYACVPMINCSGWPYEDGRPLGTPMHLAHLLLPYLRSYNHTAVVASGEGGADYPSLNFARLIVRLCSRNTYSAGVMATSGAPLRLNFMENTLGYFELNPAVTIKYPEGVAMMVGVFEVLFGTEEGQRLREWCKQRGWVLAWAHNPVDSLWDAGGPSGGGFPVHHFAIGLQAANQRILDPQVLQAVPAGWNATGKADGADSHSSSDDDDGWFDAAAEWFEHCWNEVNATMSASGGNMSAAMRRIFYDLQWDVLMYSNGKEGGGAENKHRNKVRSPVNLGNRKEIGEHSEKLPERVDSSIAASLLAVEPPFAGACADSSGCFAVRVQDGACICLPQHDETGG